MPVRPPLGLPRASQSAIGLLRLLLAASLLVPLLLFVVASWLNYRTAFEDARIDLLRTTEVAREQAAKVFDAQTQVVDRVNDLVRGMDENAITLSEKRLHEAFASIVARLPQVQSVLLVARDGHPLVSAGVYPIPIDAEVGQRDYFKAVMGGYRGPYVSSLQTGEVNRQQFFGLARPWIGADGTVAGVIDVAVSPAFFRDFYQVLIGESSRDLDGRVVNLIRDDGEILVRYPDLEGKLTRAPPTSPLFKAIRQSPESGTYQAMSRLDPGQGERQFAYRRVQGYPLYVLAGRSISAIEAGWEKTVGSHLIFGVPATLALGAVTWTALVRARREQAALARARQEIELRETAEQALLRSQRLEAVGQMTGGIAHDFNNLLTVILGSAEMLGKRAEDPARVRRIAEQISIAARRGGEVTQQLLSFSRRQFVNPELIDLDARLRHFKQLLDRAASEAVKVVLDLDGALAPVRLDAGHFEAAILNLVGNARDAMPQGGRVRIMTRNVEIGASEIPDLPAGHYVQISVIDNGSGMDGATAAKAFEPFFTTKEIGKGTGLGLSQVYGFAKQAGGDVRIITAPGAGTTIDLLLPRAVVQPGERLPGDEQATRDDGDQGGGEARSHQVILVVEDEPGVRETVVESLRDLGFVTLAADSAETALDCLRSPQRIDLLFSDVMMPGGMNGLQLSLEARRLRPGLKVLLTSGYSTDYDSGAEQEFALLPKPYDRGELAGRLRVALAG